MKAPTFKYHAPRTLAEALDLLATLEDARVLAGGQSLMPMLNLRLAAPAHLIDLGRVPELVGIDHDAIRVRVGAMTTQRAVEKSAEIAHACPLLAQAIHHVGHQQTRNRGTIGGSLCHFDPGAELPVAAAALDAELMVAGARGTRTIAFRDFAAGYLATTLAPDEMLVAVVLPRVGAREGCAFLEFNRRPADFAIISVAATISLDESGRVTRARIAIGGAQFTPVRLAAGEAMLIGATPDAALFAAAGDIAASIDCDGDHSNPPDFKRDLCRALTRRALATAATRAREASHA